LYGEPTGLKLALNQLAGWKSEGVNRPHLANTQAARLVASLLSVAIGSAPCAKLAQSIQKVQAGNCKAFNFDNVGQTSKAIDV
jgi:hypothetical protein